MARKARGKKASTEQVSNNTSDNRLSRRNLKQLTAARRREDAYRRGHSTPPPEPKYRDEPSSTPEPFPRRVRLRKSVTPTSSAVRRTAAHLEELNRPWLAWMEEQRKLQYPYYRTRSEVNKPPSWLAEVINDQPASRANLSPRNPPSQMNELACDADADANKVEAPAQSAEQANGRDNEEDTVHQNTVATRGIELGQSQYDRSCALVEKHFGTQVNHHLQMSSGMKQYEGKPSIFSKPPAPGVSETAEQVNNRDNGDDAMRQYTVANGAAEPHQSKFDEERAAVAKFLGMPLHPRVSQKTGMVPDWIRECFSKPSNHDKPPAPGVSETVEQVNNQNNGDDAMRQHTVANGAAEPAQSKYQQACARLDKLEPPKAKQQKTKGLAATVQPRFPPNFPTYHATQSLNEAAAYLANASYFVSVGGPPLADLKYGIIAVPVGEEALLFGPQPDNVVNQDFLDAVEDVLDGFTMPPRMHDPDANSEEFNRHRFDDHARSDLSASDFGGIEVAPRRVGGRGKKLQKVEEKEEERSRGQSEDTEGELYEAPKTRRKTAVPAKKAGATRGGKGGRGGKTGATNRAAATKPQGVVKTRSSRRKAGTPAAPEAATPATKGRRKQGGV